MEELNRSAGRQTILDPIFLMANSGARGRGGSASSPVRPVAGPSGGVYRSADSSNFREGLNVLESLHARGPKASPDTP